MMFRLALRSLMVHPVRSAVLAGGFGVGVAAMATLLGVGEVILDQARSPALRGGGDLVATSAMGPLTSARFILSNVLAAPPLVGRASTASPSRHARLFLVGKAGVAPLLARGGVPSLERALGDPETASVAAWVDAPADRAWSAPDPGDVLRAIDLFHAVPDVPARAASWAEWLYFNGHAGETHLYLTFLFGPKTKAGRRAAGVRLQLDHAGRRTSYSDRGEVDEAALLAGAPDVSIGKCQVRLRGLRYELVLDLPAEAPGGPRAQGELVLDAVRGRAMPPVTLRGAGGWLSGYVVPVMSGAFGGALTVGAERVSLEGGLGYHDHNWGFWQGVSWRWGQVQHDGLSFLYGRLYPPADAADPDRIPGFLAALGPDGPLGYSTHVAIEETNDPYTGRPRRIMVRGRGSSLNLTLDLAIEDVVATRMGRTAFGGDMDFLQLRARYRVVGNAGSQAIDFTASGAAETFRGR